MSGPATCSTLEIGAFWACGGPISRSGSGDGYRTKGPISSRAGVDRGQLERKNLSAGGFVTAMPGYRITEELDQAADLPGRLREFKMGPGGLSLVREREQITFKQAQSLRDTDRGELVAVFDCPGKGGVLPVLMGQDREALGLLRELIGGATCRPFRPEQAIRWS